MTEEKILIIIPTYNEIDNIDKIIREIRTINSGIDILVIDDNSPDGTAERVKELKKADPNLFLIEREGKTWTRHRLCRWVQACHCQWLWLYI